LVWFVYGDRKGEQQYQICCRSRAKITLVTKAVVDKALAESYAMRAMCYFYIVRVWGDAPVWTEPYENVSEDPEKARTPADQVITENIIADLTKAYGLTHQRANACGMDSK
jgi:hypothetical protein